MPDRNGWPRWIPAAAWIPSLGAAGVRLDVVAGLSLAAFVIPELLAYASLAQLPPVTGLYCYLVAGIAYAIFGTSRQLAVGPTSALAVVIAASVAALGGGDPARDVALASALALTVGVVGIAGRFVGLANAAYFISDPILTGFKAGAGLYIASTQLPKLFGIAGVSGNFFERIGHLIVSLPATHVPSLLFGAAAIALFIALQRGLPGRPTTLFVVVAAIVVMSLLGASRTGIHVVGELPLGLPGIRLPDIHASDIATLLPTALACFLLAYGETISVARSFAQKHGYDIDPQQELTALGAANIATGLAHGFPVAGGMSQTAVNDMGGASSPLALVVTSAAIALTLLFFAGLFHNLPEPVLAAVVLIAASHLVRIEDLKQLRLASRTEFRISLLAFAGVLLLGLLDGLLLAAVGALVMLIANAARPAVVVLGREPASGRFVDCRALSGCRRDTGRIGDPQRRRMALLQCRSHPPPRSRPDRRRACGSEDRGARSLHRADHRYDRRSSAARAGQGAQAPRHCRGARTIARRCARKSARDRRRGGPRPDCGASYDRRLSRPRPVKPATAPPYEL